jgi:colanic acid biosynthesis protein WcaH
MTDASLRRALEEIERAIPQPQDGLPEDALLLVSRMTPLINVDLLIQDDEGRTLLTWRDDEWFGRGWHVPGGIIRFKETYDRRIEACALAELDATVTWDPAPFLVTETIREERTRGHFISMLFRCRLASALDDRRRAGRSAPRRGEWQWHDAAPRDLLPVQAGYRRFFRE